MSTDRTLSSERERKIFDRRVISLSIDAFRITSHLNSNCSGLNFYRSNDQFMDNSMGTSRRNHRFYLGFLFILVFPRGGISQHIIE